MQTSGETQALVSNNMPSGFARKTRTGHEAGSTFAIKGAGAADTWAGGVSVTSYDTFWALPSGGANATLSGSLNIDSFVTVVSAVPPDGIFGFMRTSEYPIRIDSTSRVASPVGANETRAVTILINVRKSAEEKVYLRYSTDTWATSSFVRATGSETTWTATIPGIADTRAIVRYYAMTSTADTPNALTHASANYMTLSADTICTYAISPGPQTPTLTITSIPDNHDTTVASFQVRGVATLDAQTGETVMIFRNGVATDTVFLDGSLGFVGWCTVAAKSDSVTARLTSAAMGGVEVWDTRRVSLYLAPGVTITSPVNGTNAYFPIQVLGTGTEAKAGDTVHIFRNGVMVDTVYLTLALGFSGNATIASGAATVSARLTNFLGATAWDTKNLTFDTAFPRPDSTQWIGLRRNNWGAYSDDVYNDGTASYTEVVDDPDSYAGHMYYDKRNDMLYMRMALDAKDTVTWEHSVDKIRVFGWMFWIDVNMDGFPDWQISLTAQNAGNGLNVKYNTANSYDFSKTGVVTWTDNNAYKSNGRDTIWIEIIPRSKTNGDSDVYLSLAVPLSSFQAPAAPTRIFETTPFRMIFGTGSSPNSIKRDLTGYGTGEYGAAFSASEIVTTANFDGSTGGSPGGMIYDTRDTDYPSAAGTWEQGETVLLTGRSWPVRGSGNDSITVRIVREGLDVATQASTEDTIPVGADGTFANRAFWRPTTANPAALYGIWVRHPIAGDTWYLYDTFRLQGRNSSVSAFLSAPETVAVGGSIAVVLRDTDQNTVATTLQTVQVIFTNQRTTETETVTLTETAVNSGTFDVTTLATSADPADSAYADNGKLYIRPGDTITIRYVDAEDQFDSAIYSSILVLNAPATAVFKFTDAAGDGPITLLSENDTLGVRLIDQGLNRDALAVETYTIVVRNTATTETETVVLYETDSNSNTFFGVLPTDTTTDSTVSNNGKMFAVMTQYLTATFTDPYHPSDIQHDTVRILGDGRSAIRFTDAGFNTIETASIGAYLFIEVIDRNRNDNPAVQDSILVGLVTSAGDSENIRIFESANSSGIFRSGGFLVTDSTPQANNDSIIFVLAGGTISCTYVDSVPPGDSATTLVFAVGATSSGALIDSTGAAITSQSAGDSIHIRIHDLDENQSATANDTILVVITNTRTGETETAVLFETAAMSGGFETGSFRLSQSIADSVSGDGLFFALNGDTFTISYVDRNDPNDTLLLGPFTVVPAAATPTGVFPDSVVFGDSVQPIIAASDRNLLWNLSETIVVVVTNVRTGETESLVLTETAANSGIFDETGTIVSNAAADSLSGSGTLYALAGDSIRITYYNPNDPTTALLTSGPIMVQHPRTAATGTFPLSVRFPASGDAEIELAIADLDQNLSGLGAETVLVVATNNRTGDTLGVVLYEIGVNEGIFGQGAGVIYVTRDTPPGSNILHALVNDTITIRYLDPHDLTDSVTSAPILVVKDTSVATGATPSTVIIGDSVWVYISDTDQNRAEVGIDTITVVYTLHRTGETAARVISETHPNEGIFFGGLGTTGNIADSVANTTFHVLAGDTITISYIDRDDPTDTLGFGPITIRHETSAAAGIFPASIRSGDSIVPVITDTDRNRDGTRIDTIAVTVTNWRTGETEVMILYETDSNSGIFDVTRLFISENPADSGANSDTLYALAGDTITVRYVDAYVSSDSLTGGPFAVYQETSTATGTFPTAVPIGGTIGPIIRDTDRNLSGSRVDTIAVVITNHRTGETEILILYETDSNSGIFNVTTLPTSQDIGDSVDNDTLHVQLGDTITVFYQDPVVPADSVTSSPITIVPANTVCTGVFPATVLQGDSLVPVITDTDKNLSPTVVDSITVTITNQRTGETEIVVLYETDSNTNIFNVTATFLSNVPGDSVDNDTLYTRPGDTITIFYQDPVTSSDSVLSAPILVVPQPATGVISADSRFAIGESYAIRVTDGDANRDGTIVETVSVTVRNPVTDDTEVLILYETDSNSGVFGPAQLATSSSPADSASGDSRIYARAGDTLVVLYIDRNNALDTSTVDTGVAFRPASPSDSFLAETRVAIGAVLSGVYITDLNRDLDVDLIDTILVTVENLQTGETEVVTLYETGLNSGVFDSPVILVTGNAGDSTSNDGKLYASPGDSIVIHYVDIFHPADTLVTSPILAILNTTTSSLWTPASAAAGDSFRVALTDTDQNTNSTIQETVVIVVTNMTTGETETLTLWESGVNASLFDSPTIITSLLAADSASTSGKLYVRPGDTLVVRYIDPLTPTDSAVSAAILVVPETSTAFGTFPSIVTIGDSLVPVVTDTDRNRDGTRIETITVTVTNQRTGETEVMILYETDSNSGIFDVTRLPVTGSPSDSGSGSDSLYARPGDTITVHYVDAADTADSFISAPITAVPPNSVCTGVFPASVTIGDSLVPVITDTDRNRDWARIDTVAVTVTNERTGETEVMILYETDSNSGIFDVTRLPVTGAAADSGSGSDSLYARPGDTITVRYVDPVTPGDSVASLPITVLPPTSTSSGTFPPSVTIGDSLVPVITDTDRNLDGGRIDTISVTVTNQRTGETEVMILYETDSNSGIFDVTRLPVTGSPSDSGSGSDSLYVRPGDTITVRYVDPATPGDSLTSAAILAVPPSSRADSSMPTTVTIGAPLFGITVIDTDANRDVLLQETVTVMIRNERTGETEILTLYESGTANGSIFDTATLVTSTASADSVSNNGSLYMRPGDTLTVHYSDRYDASDTFRYDSILVTPARVTGVFKLTDFYGDAPIMLLTEGETLGIRLLDGGLNRDALAVETIAIIVTNVNSGETETVILTEASASADTFFGILPTDTDVADSTSNNGRIYAQYPHRLTARWLDLFDGTDSGADTVTLLGYGQSAVRITDAGSLSVETVPLGGWLYFEVIDKSGNADPNARETVAVTITTTAGDTEIITVLETANNSSIFRSVGVFVSDSGTAVENDSIIFVTLPDLITLRYVDPGTPTDSATDTVTPVGGTGSGALINASGATITSQLAGDSIRVRVTDWDENQNAAAADTVRVLLTNVRTGETEYVVLLETAAASGGFETSGFPISQSLADSASNDGVFSLLAGDTFTIFYIDRNDVTDSFQLGPYAVLPSPAASSGTVAAQVVIGDSVLPVITDTSRNLSGTRIDTIAVTVTNQSTGETAIVVLYETDSNSNIFDVTVVTTSSAPGDSGTGLPIFVRPGDTVTIRYVDPDAASDSLTLGPVTVVPETSTASISVPANVTIGQLLTGIVLTDTDRNRSVLLQETVTVLVTNTRTGETEILVLYESGSVNSPIFDTATLATSGSLADSLSGGGTLYLLPGDTITVLYVDPIVASDSVTSSPITALPPATASSGSFPTTVVIGDSLQWIVITDTDQNKLALVQETIVVLVTNNRTGETEYLTLYESGSVSSGIFDTNRLATSADPAVSGSQSGTLYLLPGDTLTVRYVDPNDATDSVTSPPITALPPATASSGSFPTAVAVGDSLQWIVITDTDQNMLALVQETIVVLVTNNRTGETEYLTLYESGSVSSDIFDTNRLATSANPADSGAQSGTLYLLPGDTITVRYVDPNDATDSVASPPITATPPATASSGSFPTTVAIGDSLQWIVITDTDQNMLSLVQETIVVLVTNNRTGETEYLTLYESGSVSSGIFDTNRLATSANPADSSAQSGTLYLLPGDTITVRYVDPNDGNDSVTSSPILATPPATASSGSFPTTVVIGDSLQWIVITDTDQNMLALVQETIAVLVTNNRTGETEYLTLYESGSVNSPIFDTNRLATSANPADSGAQSGTLYLLPGDTITVRYVDPNDGNDSVASAPITARPPATASSGSFPTTVAIGDSLQWIVITDTDQNMLALVQETIVVLVTNNRTGETEYLTLYESGSVNSPIFDTNRLATSANPADSGSQSGTLYLLPGDTITVRYVDPNDGNDSVTSSPILATPPATASSGSFPTTVAIGDSLQWIVITDTDQNMLALVQETIVVLVTNNRTGETEYLTLYESGSVNSPIFDTNRLPTSANPADSGSQSGGLYLLPGDTITVRYVDPNDATDSVTSSPITALPAATVCTGIFPTSVRATDSIYPTIIDLDQNRLHFNLETVAVVVTNNRTGESEILVLTETAPGAGIFNVAGLRTSTNIADSVSGSETLYVMAGDTITIRYVDPYLATDSVTSPPIPITPFQTPSSGTFPTSVAIGDSLVPIITDTDKNRFPGLTETVTVTVTNWRTGETEVMILYETDSNSGIFNVTRLPVSGNPSDSASRSETLYVLAGDTITIRYLDAADTTDSVTSAPITARVDSSIATGTTALSVVIGDSIAPVITDPDRNLNGTRIDTITVVVTNWRTGETEVMILYETDSNSGIFNVTRLPLTGSASDSGSGSDSLYVRAGDTVTVRYQDPSYPADSLVMGPAAAVFGPTVSAVTVGATVTTGDSIAPIVTDANRNLDALVRDTIAVTVINTRTGETETLILVETDSNSGIFNVTTLPVSKNPADSASGSETLVARILDLLRLDYADPTTPSDSRSVTITVASAYSGGAIQQIDITKIVLGAETTLFIFRPTNSRGDSLPGLDGEPIRISISDSVGGTGRFFDTTIFMTGDSAVSIYNKAERTTLTLSFTILGETFHPIVALGPAGESTPKVVVGRRDTTLSEGILTIPAGLFDTAGYRLIVEPHFDFSVESPTLGGKVDQANDVIRLLPAKTVLPVLVRPEHQYYIVDEASGRQVRNFDTHIAISITYPDLDDNGLVDNTQVDETTLRMYYLDEDLNRWVLVPNATLDAAKNVMSAQVNHLTIFTLIGAGGATDAARVAVYPNPYRPNDGNRNTGIEYSSGDGQSGILMDGIPAGARIRVFTTLGERVMQTTVSTGGTYQWDVRNERGVVVSSGVYIVVIEAPNGSRLVEKVAIIR